MTDVRPGSTQSLRPDVSNNEDARKLVVVDIGAAGGLRDSWIGQENNIIGVLVEPDPEQAAKLRSEPSKLFKTVIIQTALGAVEGDGELNITKSIGCSSLLVPNSSVLARYSVSPAFDVIRKEKVSLTTYSKLFSIGKAPKPDVIKIDVQGFEYEVLVGFGDLLSSCLAIQLETHIQQLYVGQKLFGDVYTLLNTFGFGIRKMQSHSIFDGDVVEMDLWCTVGRDRADMLTDEERQKLAMIEKEWRILPSKRQFRMTDWDFERQIAGLKT